MSRLAELPPSVRGYLQDFAARWRRLVGLRALGTALATLAIWIACTAAADRFFHLGGSTRVVLLIAGALAAISAGIARLGPIRGPTNWIAMASIIEQHDPRFNQRFITITSRVLGAPEHRGSDEILSHLLREVEQRAAEGDQRKILRLRSIARPWYVFALAIAVLILAGQFPIIGVPRLLARAVSPLSSIPPVTTAELTVKPQDIDVNPAEPLRIEAHVLRNGSAPVWVYINDDDANWSRYAMDDAGGGWFTFTVNAVGRDLRYYVSAADAVAPAEHQSYAVRVKRPPAVAEFRVRYTYPAYTGKAPFTTTNTDGLIEAPIGSEAQLTLIATEPLQSALLTLGDQKILMEKTGEDNVRRATLRVQRDLNYDVDLISARDVRGGGPGKMTLHATADRPPTIRLLQAGQTLRLNRLDALPISYQATDDFGIDAIHILVAVNGDLPQRIPLRLHGDRHRQEDAAQFDLGSIHFNVGDLLTLTMAARDTAGQETLSDALRVLIAPRSVDLDAHERIDELSAAARLASTLVDELAESAKAIDAAPNQKDQQSPQYLAASAVQSRHLSIASESATFVRQCLLRTMTHNERPELATALAAWIDVAQQQAQAADDLFRRAGSPQGMGDRAGGRVHEALDRARELAMQLKVAAVGERAAALAADRENLNAVAALTPSADSRVADRLAQILQAANDDVSASAAEIDVNLSGADIEAELAAKVAEERELLRSKQPIDFVAAANEWAQQLQAEPHSANGLEARLATAAQVEAVRKDADLARARDLELLSRAMAAMTSTVLGLAPGKPAPAAQLNNIVRAMEALQREHALARQPAAGRSLDELRAARTAAAQTREKLAQLVGDSQLAKSMAATGGRAGDVESLALRAGAAAARRDYKRVADDDKALAQRLSEAARRPGGRTIDDLSPAASQMVDERLQRIALLSEAATDNMALAENIDKLGQIQEKVIQETKASKASSRDLAQRELAIAEQIVAIERQRDSLTFPTTAPVGSDDDSSWRGQATSKLLSAQEALSGMSQALIAAQEAAVAHRKAADRAASARKETEHASPDRQAILSRAAALAEKDVADAASRLDAALEPILPQVAEDLADALAPFTPETAGARDALVGPLGNALSAMHEACDGTDYSALTAAAAGSRKAIDAAQQELARAQSHFTEHDPLAAARLFALAAADTLARHPADPRLAAAQQAHVAVALSRAWNRHLHRSAEFRLALAPTLQTVYGAPTPAPGESTANALAPSLGNRDWARLRPHEGDDMNTAPRDPDPPGYEESLRLYFQSISRAAEDKTK